MKAESLPGRAPPAKGRRRPAILVIDSDAAVQEAMRKRLEMEGYEVHQAFAGNKALDIFLERKPAAILMDIDFARSVSEINGIDLIRYIKRLRRNPEPVILYAAQSERVPEAMDAGATMFVPKSAPADEVVRTLMEILGVARDVDRKSPAS